jgi:hypothetical protein
MQFAVYCPLPPAARAIHEYQLTTEEFVGDFLIIGQRQCQVRDISLRLE